MDGRVIYQKTIAIGGLKNNGKTSVAHQITDLDMVVSIRGFAAHTGNTIFINLPHAADQQAYSVTVYADATHVNIQTYADQSGYITSFVTIEYVKK